MAGSTIKLGVDVTDFKRGMTEAQASVKTLDAAIKTNEKSMQLYGKSESYVTTQADLLNKKLEEQKKICQNAEKSLKAMEQNGVSKSSKAYQEMQRKMIEARGAMIDTEVALNQLATGEAEAAKGADQLANSIGGISKKISLDQVIGGINFITTGLEHAAQKAVQLGETIWNAVMDRAKWADDTAQQALMYGIDLDTFLRMQKLVQNGLDTSVDSMLNAQSKLNRGIGEGSSAVMEQLQALGLTYSGKNGEIGLISDDSTELFWKAGRALMDLGDAFDKEAAAQKLFGRSWKELVPLFTDYQSMEDYQKALEEVNVNSEEDVKVLAELNDKIGELKGNLETLSGDILAKLAPALKDGAEALNGVLESVLEYLRTPAGQESLQKLGDAISGLFGDLSKIDPEKVVHGFVDVFTKVTDGIQWLVDNQETAKGILGAIVGGWGALTIGENVLKVFKFIDGIRGLTGTAAADGAAAGAAWGSSFAGAVLKAAPWLLFLYELLNPAETADNSIVDANGNLTEEGLALQAEQQAEEARLAGRTDRERWLDEMSAKYNGTMGISAVNMEMFGHDPIYEAIQAYWDKYRTGTSTTEDWQALQGLMDGPKWEQFINVAKFMYSLDRATEDLPNEAFGFNENFDEWLKENGEGMPIVIDPVVPETAAEDIEMDIGKVTVPVGLVVEDLSDDAVAALFGSQGKANGMWAVPYDGYLARLHKNEMVVPAREVASRSYSSNLYIENNYMNNGTDAEGLAAAMAAAQRRKMAGFGS